MGSDAPILVTRSRTQAGKLTLGLQDAGYVVEEVPTIAFRALAIERERAAALCVAGYEHLVFTSANAIRHFDEVLRNHSLDRGSLAEAQVWCAGPATARVAADYGWGEARVPQRYVAEGLLEEMVHEELAGKRVLLPRAAEARELLPDGLRAAGAHVDVVSVYESFPPEDSRRRLRELCERGVLAWTAASSNTARFFDALLDDEGRSYYRSIPVFSIGPITSQTLRDLGYHDIHEAHEATIASLVEHLATELPRSPS